MRKNNELYEALERILKGHKCTFEQIVDLLRCEVTCEFKPSSLRTILYRQVDKGMMEHEGVFYWMEEERKKVGEESVIMEKNQLKEYLEMLLSVTTEKEKELLRNPFEQYEDEKSWAEAKKMYSVNKKVQNIIKKELERIK